MNTIKRNGWMISNKIEAGLLIYAACTAIYALLNREVIENWYILIIEYGLFFLILKLIEPLVRGGDYIAVNFIGNFDELVNSLSKIGFELVIIGNKKYIFDTKTFILANTRCIVSEESDNTYMIMAVPAVFKRLRKSIGNITLIDKTNK